MTKQIIDMNKAELAEMYIDKIGYNPFEDDPTISTETVRDTLTDWFVESISSYAHESIKSVTGKDESLTLVEWNESGLMFETENGGFICVKEDMSNYYCEVEREYLT